MLQSVAVSRQLALMYFKQYSAWPLWIDMKNEDGLKNEDILRNEDDLKNG